MIKQELGRLLKEALASAGVSLEGDVLLEQPKHEDHGDFSINICFSLAKQFRKAPKQIAEELVVSLSADDRFKGWLTFSPLNGFINLQFTVVGLWLRFSHLFSEGVAFPKQDTRILLEYVSANPTGPLHIGHGRWAVLGDALARLLRFTQHDIQTEFYINDAGNQIQKLNDSVAAVKKGVDIPEDGYHGHYIHELAGQDGDPVQLNLDHQKQILSQMGVHFDCWFSEKSLHDSGEVTAGIERLKDAGYTFEKEGALWFQSTAFGDEKDRVLIKADGAFTYFAVDVAYHDHKLGRGFSRLINIWGADHHGYVARVKAAVQALCGELFQQDNFVVKIGQLVNLVRGGEPVRMSKRTGDMISLEEVVQEIGSDAVRYFLIEKSPDTHVEFDLDLAIKKSAENPVYYIQYSHARLCSILRKAEIDTIEPVAVTDLDEKERKLIFQCVIIYDMLWHSATALAPYRVAHYVLGLARAFHHFYEACPILKAEENIKHRRLFILQQVKQCIGICLEILGITAPEKM